MTVKLSQKAQADLRQIYNYRASQNPQSPDMLVEAIDRKFGQLSRFPFLGRERANLLPGLRSVVVGLHVIFYVLDNDDVIIVRIVDGRMDLDEELMR